VVLAVVDPLPSMSHTHMKDRGRTENSLERGNQDTLWLPRLLRAQSIMGKS
jgi:hypothetical protein